MHGESKEVPCPAYLVDHGMLDRKRSMARFRLGGAPIRANLHHHLPYTARICQRCDECAVDNESHMVFECESTRHVRYKARYKKLFEKADGDLHRLMQCAYDSATSRNLMDCVSEMMHVVERFSTSHGLVMTGRAPRQGSGLPG